MYNICDSAVISSLRDQLSSLDKHAQLTRCFSAVAELLVKFKQTLCLSSWLCGKMDRPYTVTLLNAGSDT